MKAVLLRAHYRVEIHVRVRRRTPASTASAESVVQPRAQSWPVGAWSSAAGCSRRTILHGGLAGHRPAMSHDDGPFSESRSRRRRLRGVKSADLGDSALEIAAAARRRAAAPVVGEVRPSEDEPGAPIKTSPALNSLVQHHSTPPPPRRRRAACGGRH